MRPEAVAGCPKRNGDGLPGGVSDVAARAIRVAVDGDFRPRDRPLLGRLDAICEPDQQRADSPNLGGRPDRERGAPASTPCRSSQPRRRTATEALPSPMSERCGRRTRERSCRPSPCGRKPPLEQFHGCRRYPGRTRAGLGCSTSIFPSPRGCGDGELGHPTLLAPCGRHRVSRESRRRSMYCCGQLHVVPRLRPADVRTSVRPSRPPTRRS